MRHSSADSCNPHQYTQYSAFPRNTNTEHYSVNKYSAKCQEHKNIDLRTGIRGGENLDRCLHRLMADHRRFKGTCCLHILHTSEKPAFSSLRENTEAAGNAETPAIPYEAIRTRRCVLTFCRDPSFFLHVYFVFSSPSLFLFLNVLNTIHFRTLSMAGAGHGSRAI